ncbi:hypothetical protein ACFL6P_05040 [Candidatus Latescibacterota bacterium]
MSSPLKKSFAAEQLSKRKKPPLLIIVFAIIALVAIGYALYIQFGDKGIPTEDTPITSLAVLPLDNISDDSVHESFAEGMHEALITNLSKISALRVISRTSAMRFINSEKSLPEIAAELNVDALIEGSVYRAENTVRITVQLIKAFPEQHLWANDYVRDLKDVIVLQQEVAREIADEIEITVTSEEKEQLSSTRTVDPDAYDLYLMGLHVGINKAVDYFQKAIEKDSSFAAPYAEIAYYWATRLVRNEEGWAKQVNIIEARDALKRAFELDDTIPGAYFAQGYINLTYEWDWHAAEENFKKAIDLDPSYMRTYTYIDDLLTILRKEEEALEILRKGEEIDPLSIKILTSTMNTLTYLRNYEEAEQVYKKMVEIDPTNQAIYSAGGIMYAVQGRYAEALKAFTKSSELAGYTGPDYRFGYVYGLMGKREEAEEIQEEWLKENPPPNPGQYWLGIGLKDYNNAYIDDVFLGFESLYNERDYNIFTFILWQIRYANEVTSDPRWNELMRKLGLPES